MKRKDCEMNTISKIDKCSLCEKKAEYVLLAVAQVLFNKRIEVKFLCEEHKNKWARNELDV